MEVESVEPLSATDIARYVLVVVTAAAIGVTAGSAGVFKMPIAGAAIAVLTMRGFGIGQSLPPTASLALRLMRAVVHGAASALLIFLVHVR